MELKKIKTEPLEVLEERHTFDNMATTAVFSHCKPNPHGETAEEQRHTDNNFICSRGRNLRPLNNGFVSARWVSVHLGIDVIISSGPYKSNSLSRIGLASQDACIRSSIY
jgi:hypothetical protein